MKMKFFTLIIAILCLSMLFVACNDGKVVCDGHTDANADKLCDTCSAALCEEHKDSNADQICDVCTIAIEADKCAEGHVDADLNKYCDICARGLVTITQIVAPEAGTEMTVKPLPETNDIESYYDLTVEKVEPLEQIATIENLVELSGKYAYTKEEVAKNEEENEYVHKVFDYMTGKAAFSYTAAENEYVSVGLDDYYMTVFVGSYDEDYNFTYSLYKVLAYDGSVIYDVMANEMDEEGQIHWYGMDNEWSATELFYFQIDKTIWAVDTESGEIINTFDEKAFVQRPNFDVIYNGVGYIEYENTIYTYDITNWIECTFSYELDSYFFDYDWFVLEDGNILLQTIVALPKNEASFDVVLYDDKYDGAHTIIDIKTGETKNIEFGYLIEELYLAEDLDQTAKANYAEIVPISNYTIDDNGYMIVALDNELNILADLTLLDEAYPVADGILLNYNYYDDNTYIRKTVDTNGKLIAYIPQTASIYDGYIFYDNGIYNFKMELILDLDGGEYDDWALMENYILLKKTTEEATEYYYYNASSKAPAKISYDNMFVSFYEDYGYEIYYTVEDKTVYEFYGADGSFVFSSEDGVRDIDYAYDDCYAAYFYDGTVIIFG